MSTYLKDVVVTTRKRHRCLGCLEYFPAGTAMRYVVTVDDISKEIDASYTCSDCDQFIEQHRDEVINDFGYMEEGCVTEARQRMGEGEAWSN